MCLLPIASRVENFSDCTHLPPPGALRSPWFGKLLIWILLAATGVAIASDRLVAADISIPNVKSPAGGSVNLSVQYRGQGAAVAAIQFDLEYDRSILTITAAAGSVATNAGKALTTSVLPTGRTRFVIAGFNRNVIADGSVVDLTIRVGTGSSVGPYRLEISNALGADATPKAVSIRIVKSGLVVVVHPSGEEPAY